ncbi:MAG: hypothetical protein KDN22_32155 [Verrucomicrobiae bacterium]|nr:hypothetical protein [Verrucomicrobiae bacterium]
MDEIRLVAIVIMVVDHSLLFLTNNSVLSGVARATLTRCAEPLFVFVFASLAIRSGQPVRLRRWLQIAVVSAATSVILSTTLDRAMMDILVSIALVAPLVPFVSRLPPPLVLVCTYVTAVLAVIPLTVFGVEFNYNPILILYQAMLVRLGDVNRGLNNPKLHIIVSSILVIVIAVFLKRRGIDATTTVLIVGFGHPLAYAVIRVVSDRRLRLPNGAVPLARHPLAVYASHLIVLAALARGF